MADCAASFAKRIPPRESSTKTAQWLVSMTSRQIGHFFFEPQGYDEVNQASHAHKEQIKVGYNLRRKIVLLALWGGSPLLVMLQPDLWGWVRPPVNFAEFLHHVGWLWLAIGVGGLVFRTLQLFVTRGVQTGLVWATKILTDPFNDIAQYHSAPGALLRGELIDPMLHVAHGPSRACAPRRVASGAPHPFRTAAPASRAADRA